MVRHRVLIVDDEIGVRQVLARMLRYRGYEVELANNAAQALTVLDSDRRFAAVLVDLVMPGMEGGQLIQQMQLLDPGLGFLVISGKLLSPQERNEIQALGAECLPKPFANQEVLETIDRISQAAEERRKARLSLSEEDAR